MNEALTNALINLNKEIERLVKRYRILWSTLEHEIEEKAKESEKAELMKNDKGEFKGTSESEQNGASSTAELESYLDDVIKKSSEIRIKHCKLDFDSDLEAISDNEDLTLLANETLTAQEEKKKEIKKSKEKTAILKLNQKTEPPVSARQRGKAYKPPPLSKTKGYQTTYLASYRSAGATLDSNSKTRNSNSRNGFLKGDLKQSYNKSKDAETSNHGAKDKGPSKESMVYVSRDTVLRNHSTNFKKLFSEGNEVSDSLSTASDQLSVSLDAEFTLKSPDLVNSTAIEETSNKRLPKLDPERKAMEWPPKRSRKEKIKEVLVDRNVLQDLMKIQSKLVKYSKINTSVEVEKSCNELESCMKSNFARNSASEELISLGSKIDELEIEILSCINSSNFSKEIRLHMSNKLNVLKKKLAELKQQDSSIDPKYNGEQLVNELRLLKCFHDGAKPTNITCDLLQKVSESEVTEFASSFDLLMKQIDLRLQNECSELLDNLLGSTKSISQFAVENVDLLKTLYSIVFHNGTKFPNFVINDL